MKKIFILTLFILLISSNSIVIATDKDEIVDEIGNVFKYKITNPIDNTDAYLYRLGYEPIVKSRKYGEIDVYYEVVQIDHLYVPNADNFGEINNFEHIWRGATMNDFLYPAKNHEGGGNWWDDPSKEGQDYSQKLNGVIYKHFKEETNNQPLALKQYDDPAVEKYQAQFWENEDGIRTKGNFRYMLNKEFASASNPYFPTDWAVKWKFVHRNLLSDPVAENPFLTEGAFHDWDVDMFKVTGLYNNLVKTFLSFRDEFDHTFSANQFENNFKTYEGINFTLEEILSDANKMDEVLNKFLDVTEVYRLVTDKEVGKISISYRNGYGLTRATLRAPAEDYKKDLILNEAIIINKETGEEVEKDENDKYILLLNTPYIVESKLLYIDPYNPIVSSTHSNFQQFSGIRANGQTDMIAEKWQSVSSINKEGQHLQTALQFNINGKTADIIDKKIAVFDYEFTLNEDWLDNFGNTFQYGEIDLSIGSANDYYKEDNYFRENDYQKINFVIDDSMIPPLVKEVERDLRIKTAKIYRETGELVHKLDSSDLTKTIALSSKSNYFVTYEAEFLVLDKLTGEISTIELPSTTNLKALTDVHYLSPEKLKEINPVDGRILNNGDTIHFGNQLYWNGSGWTSNSVLENKSFSIQNYDTDVYKNSFEIIGKQTPFEYGKITLELMKSENNMIIDSNDCSEIIFTFDDTVDYGVALGYLYTPFETFKTLTTDGSSYGYDKYSLSGVAIEAKVNLLDGNDEWTPEVLFEFVTTASGNKTVRRESAGERINIDNPSTIIKYTGYPLTNTQGYLDISVEIDKLDANLKNNHSHSAMTPAEANIGGKAWECGSVSDTNSKKYLDTVNYFIKNLKVLPEEIFTKTSKEVQFSFSAQVGLGAGGESLAVHQGMYPEPVHIGWQMDGRMLWETEMHLDPFLTRYISASAEDRITVYTSQTKTFLAAINGGGSGGTMPTTTTRQYEVDYSDNSDVQVVMSTDPGTECLLQPEPDTTTSNAWEQDIRYSDIHAGEWRTITIYTEFGSYPYTYCRYTDRSYTTEEKVGYSETYSLEAWIRETNTTTWKNMYSRPTIKAGRMFEIEILSKYRTNRYSGMIWGRTSGCPSRYNQPMPSAINSSVNVCLSLSGPWSQLTPNVVDPRYGNVIYEPYSSSGNWYRKDTEYRMHTSGDPAGLGRHVYKSDYSLKDSDFGITFLNYPFRGTPDPMKEPEDDKLLQISTSFGFKIRDVVEYIHEIDRNN